MLCQKTQKNTTITLVYSELSVPISSRVKCRYIHTTLNKLIWSNKTEDLIVQAPIRLLLKAEKLGETRCTGSDVRDLQQEQEQRQRNMRPFEPPDLWNSVKLKQINQAQSEYKHSLTFRFRRYVVIATKLGTDCKSAQ